MSIRSLLAAIAENSGSTEMQFQNMRRRQEDEKARRKRRARATAYWQQQKRRQPPRTRKLNKVPRFPLDEILGVDINP